MPPPPGAASARGHHPGPRSDMAEEHLERRIARLESRAEIAELLARYAFLIDDHEFDALGELFTPDARFGSPGSTHTGRAAIVANYRTVGDLYPITLHEARGFVMDFTDDDHARGQVTGFSEQASARNTVITSFRYDDEYVRLDGRWRFASRQVRTLYAMTHAEHASGVWPGGCASAGRTAHRPPPSSPPTT